MNEDTEKALLRILRRVRDGIDRAGLHEGPRDDKDLAAWSNGLDEAIRTLERRKR